MIEASVTETLKISKRKQGEGNMSFSWTRRVAAWAFVWMCGVTAFSNVANATDACKVVDLRCEYRENPLGIDATAPRLSWRIEQEDGRRGIRQTAYQVRVASSKAVLEQDETDLWDSGKVESDKHFQVEYAGVPLTSRTRCYWQVRVWDEAGQASDWSVPALWTMGLLERDDWMADWIGYDAAYELTDAERADDRVFNVNGTRWVSIPGRDARPSVPTAFRHTVELPGDRTLRRAVLVLYAFNECDAWVNGTAVGSAYHWEKTARLDVTGAMRPGKNQIALLADIPDPHRPAVRGRFVMQFESGDDLNVPINSEWKTSQEFADGWKEAGFDDEGWRHANEGGSPWGSTPGVSDLARVPAPYLRREFDVDQPIRRATVYVTALGTYELRLNGERVGHDVLAPGWTEFRRRVHYQTYDVTTQVQQGDNVIAAILGDGWFASNLAHLGRRNMYGGRPRLLVRLEIEHADGEMQSVVSDGEWRASYGPIRHADIQIGCEYDARLEMPGWDRTGFDDSAWEPVFAISMSGRVDVSRLLTAAIEDDRLDIEITNESMGGDPVPGVVKVLEVAFEADGETHTRTMREYGRLNISGEGLRIISALYGRGAGNRVERPELQASVADPSRVIDELPAVRLTEPRPGRWTFDLGQNMVGWVRSRCGASRAADHDPAWRNGECRRHDLHCGAARCAGHRFLHPVGRRRGGAGAVFHLSWFPACGDSRFDFAAEAGGCHRHRCAHADAAHGAFREFACAVEQALQQYHLGQKGNFLEYADRLSAARRAHGLDRRHAVLCADGPV
jgi:alpha-L-rhamnosidase